jgi:hypothetical protein
MVWVLDNLYDKLTKRGVGLETKSQVYSASAMATDGSRRLKKPLSFSITLACELES